MANEIIAMTMKYRPVPISKVFVDTPEFPHADTTANPRPVPNDSRTKVRANEATAPASTAARKRGLRKPSTRRTALRPWHHGQSRWKAMGGPAQPSPIVGPCLNGGLGWLESSATVATRSGDQKTPRSGNLKRH